MDIFCAKVSKKGSKRLQGAYKKCKRLRDNGLTGFLCFCIFVPKKTWNHKMFVTMRFCSNCSKKN